jgi:hypothetical protein
MTLVNLETSSPIEVESDNSVSFDLLQLLPVSLIHLELVGASLQISGVREEHPVKYEWLQPTANFALNIHKEKREFASSQIRQADPMKTTVATSSEKYQPM